MEPATRSAPNSGGLRRELGLGSAAAAVAGEAIAVGIFLTPAGMAKALGSPFWLLAVWLFMGAITVSGALCFRSSTSRSGALAPHSSSAKAAIFRVGQRIGE